MQQAVDVIKELKRLSTPKKAAISRRFFKTGVGQYGHGDVFIGVTVPEQRAIAKKYKDLPLAEIQKLIRHKVHENRMTGLFILAGQFQKADEGTKDKLARFYLSHTKYINNWDLVDSSARQILGMYLLDKERDILYKLAQSRDLWERRIAIIATQAFIMHDKYGDTLRIAKILLKDDHDLIHKAVGWTLREVGNRSARTEEAFLKQYEHQMPRTMLRYAIEKFSEKKRLLYLHKQS